MGGRVKDHEVGLMMEGCLERSSLEDDDKGDEKGKAMREGC